MNDKLKIDELFGATAYDKDGDKLGSVKEVFIDDKSGQPTFVEVHHGLFGMASSLVPLRGHRLEGDRLELAFDKDRIKDAPNVDVDNGLSPEEQQEVYAHYGVGDAADSNNYHGDVRDGRDNGLDSDHRRDVHGGAVGPTGTAAGQPGIADAPGQPGVTDATTGPAAGEHGQVAHDPNREHPVEASQHDRLAEDRVAEHGQTAHDPARHDNGGDMVRSEERLNVNKQTEETGRVRLRKYVVTENQQVEVPVTREEVRLEREPISAEEAKGYTGDIGEDEAAVTLHEERVNVQKETVPVEKVHLGTEQVQDSETVNEQVRKEQFDVEGNDRPETDRR